MKKKIFNIESYINKKVEKKQNVNTNNFNNILDNIIHLIEMRDQHNNSLIHTKVTNLLLDEKNKLLQSPLNKKKEKKIHKRKYWARREIKSAFNIFEIIPRELKLNYESANTLIYERTRRRLNTIKYNKNYNLKLLIKYRLYLNKNIYVSHRNRNINIDIDRDYQRTLNSPKNLDSISSSKSLSFDSYKDPENSYVKKYDNNYELVYEEKSDRLYKTKRYNYLKRKSTILNDFKSNNNKINNSLNNINNFKDNNFSNNNNDDIKDNLFNKEKSHLFNLLNNNYNNNNIRNGNFSYYKTDNKKKKENNSKDKQSQEYLPLNKLLDNLNKLNSIPFFVKNKIGNKSNNNNDLPIFEQMVNNDRLIRLIHEYIEEKNKVMDKKEKKEINEKNKENEEMDKKSKENKREYDREKGEIYKSINKPKIKKDENNEENQIFEKYNDNYFNKTDNNQDNADKEYNDIMNKNNEEKNIIDNNNGNNIKKEYYLYNSFDNKNINKTKLGKEKSSQEFTMKKIDLGLEIIRHICNEIHINKNDQNNLESAIFKLIKISRKDDTTDEEEKFIKKMLKPIDDITREYLENMRKINLLNKKPRFLFDKILKKLLRKKLKELLDIGAEAYFLKDEEEEKKEKEKEKQKKIYEINDYKKIQEEEEKKNKIKYKYFLKSLIFDHSYFFKSKKKKEQIIKSLENTSIIKEETIQENSFKKSFMDSLNSFEISEIGRRSSFNFRYRSNSKYKKTKKAIGLKIIQDEPEEIILNKKNLLTEEDEEKLKNEEILDKKLHSFFKKINQLKNVKNNEDEEKLKIFIDEEVEKFSYAQRRKIEDRKYNFFKDLKLARINAKNEKKFCNNKLQYHSPIIFYNCNNNTNI